MFRVLFGTRDTNWYRPAEYPMSYPYIPRDAFVRVCREADPFKEHHKNAEGALQPDEVFLNPTSPSSTKKATISLLVCSNLSCVAY
jgi:hypothetical protein